MYLQEIDPDFLLSHISNTCHTVLQSKSQKPPYWIGGILFHTKITNILEMISNLLEHFFIKISILFNE